MTSSKRRLGGILVAAAFVVAACSSSATTAPGASTAPGSSTAGDGGGGLFGSFSLPSGLLGGGSAAVNASTILTAAVAAQIIGGNPTLQPGSINVGPVSMTSYASDSGDDVTVYVETVGSGLEATMIQAAIQSAGTSGDMTPISGLGDAAGKVVDANSATVAFGKNGTIVVVAANVAAQSGADLEPKVEAVAQQVAGQL